ncbi:uncharacterized protein LOC131402329 isoform X2 [Diceros bicornis minor]|uniref:uncharacterized protein LOC131402329 isoform X2 n=1 Tax=Diceros bicornis minor TaxID=77932 RepID=UPI0026F05087|nr:uncharacterized protein LOC131402329 isoform X2 [Diceros bicornis minor]XP_058393133.1 uncharacterized protein LOC131402329 isoform X2 [Diceros bicornis minor]
MMPQKLSQSPFTLQQMSPRSQPWKMCRMNTATPAPGPSAGSSCQRWGLRTPGLAALLLLLVPGEQEHGCRLQEQVEKDSELKRGSCRQPGAHAAGGAGRAEGRGSLTEQPAAPSRVWWQQWDPKETPDGFEDEKQSLVPAKPLSSPSFSLFLRAVGVRDPEELLLVLHCQLCSAENLHKPPEEHTGEVSRGMGSTLRRVLRSSCGTPCRGEEGGGNQRPSGQNSPWLHPLYLTLSGRV